MQFALSRATAGKFTKTTMNNFMLKGGIGMMSSTFLFNHAFASDSSTQPPQQQQQPAVCPVNHGKPAETVTTTTTTPGVCPVNHGKPVDNTTTTTPGVCPVNHGKAVEEATPGVCPVNHGKVSTDTQEQPQVCPINHTKTTTTENAPAVCPVNHGKSVTDATTTTTPGVCPVNHGKAAESTTTTDSATTTTTTEEKPYRKVCPVKHGKKTSTNSDGDRYVDPSDVNGVYHQEGTIHRGYDVSKIDFPNTRWGFVIPATGRGNSDDGAHWVNPTPLELYRACHAKDEDGVLEESAAAHMADVHSFVVSSSWSAIYDWEQKYIDNGTCSDGPSLLDFDGKFDQPSPKSRIFTYLFDVPLYDRHDWIIDRCGTKVRYVLDYYDDGEGGVGNVDARPALDSPQALYDRVEMAVKQAKNGQQWW